MTAPAQPARPPVLLTMGSYPPTLAAIRCLGRAGVPVTLAEWRRFVPARWSRFVTRRVACPDLEARPDDYLAWLLEFGAREPGHVLLASSDDLAWLYARHREALSRHFTVGVPGLESIYALVNKVRLQEACAEVRIDVPRSWFAEGRAALAALAGEVAYPVVVKPQTQVFLWPHQKGRVVRSAEALPALYDDFLACTHHHPSLTAQDPGVDRPMLQAFEEGAAAGIYNLAGYAGPEGLSVVLASRKILQRPRLLGVGLVFEEAEVRPELVEPLLALFRKVGYQGVFEVEYLEAGARRLLIDVNPRFYGEMAFEVARGAPLPWLAYLGALAEASGDRTALALAVAEARRAVATAALPGSGRIYRHWCMLELHFLLLRLAGRMRSEERGRWRAWLAARRDRTLDAVYDADDRWPWLVDALDVLCQPVRHPRATWRQAREV
jgi:predicted ATP-grasp superfamily ATP-dependent carboligase